MLSDAQREQLAARLRKGRAPAATGIGRRPPGAELPLSYGQEQLWFIDQFAPGLPVYNVATGLRLAGSLQPVALGRAITGLLTRHEVLRTRLVTTEHGRPVQLIDQPTEFDLQLLDLSELAPHRRQRRLRQRAGELAAVPFELAVGPLFRAELVRLDEQEHVLLIVVHHAIFDGWSFGVLRTELAALYAAELTGQPAGLAPLAVQFGDYASWERERLQGPALAPLLDFWQRELADLPTLELPTDRARPLLESHRGGVCRLQLDPGLLTGLRALSAREGCTLFVTLLAAVQLLLSRYSGQDDIVVGTPSANRSRAELAPLIGFLVNTLPIRTDLAGDPSFSQLLHRVRERTVACYAHAEIPFGKLVEALQIERDPSRTPVYQVSFAQADTGAEPVTAAGLRFSPFDEYPDPDTAKFDLALFAGTGEQHFELAAQYALDLFEPASAQRLLDHLGQLLAAVVATPDARLSELRMLTEAELYQELIGYNQSERALPIGCLHRLFEQQVARSPDAPAAVLAGLTVSYAELNRRANRLAHWLSGQRRADSALIGLSMPASIDRLAAVLGVLKAGCGYVPIDPDLPAQRREFMASDARLTLVLTERLLAEHAGPIGQQPPDNLPGDSDPSELAYVIYTSGSTGRPKGVMVEHRQVANFVAAMADAGLLAAADRVLQFASLSFDVSVLDLFGCLLSGGCAVLADSDTKLSPPRLAELIRAERVSLACLPPAVLSVLVDQQLPDLAVLISAGEQLPTAVAQAWLRPGLRLFNGYGPTETTVLSLIGEVDGGCWPAPIGRPLANYQAYLLDEQGNPVPVGVIGQLHTGGAGVARGYLNQPELTAERFVADPFSDRPEARLYRTGDLARRLPDGRISFVGRADGQVKLRGLRIELGEIEAALTSHAAVGQAVVLVTEQQAGQPQLTGYLRGAADQVIDCEELKQHLAGWLPGYMIPAQLLQLTEFPLNSSGKIDRRALPAPPRPATAADSDQADQPPRTLTEQALVELYRRLLGLPRVGALDSFFELGGNSLQAMQLVSGVRAELGVDLAVTAVFLAPTVRQLSVLIEAQRFDGAGAASDGSVQQLSDGLGTEPLFLLHAVSGTVFGYTALATALADRYRVYGIQAIGLTNTAGIAGAPVVAQGLAELAAGYLAEIRRVQPDGPYRLGGWSMGALLAHQIAGQLCRAGAQVSELVLLDPPFEMPVDPASDGTLAGQFVTDVLRTLGRAEQAIAGADADAAAGEPATADAALHRLAAILDPTGADPAAVGAELHRRFAVYAAHRRLMSGYRPAGPVPADALLISAAGSPNATVAGRWAELIDGRLHTVSVPADHYSLLHPPACHEVAAVIGKSPII